MIQLGQGFETESTQPDDGYLVVGSDSSIAVAAEDVQSGNGVHSADELDKGQQNDDSSSCRSEAVSQDSGRIDESDHQVIHTMSDQRSTAEIEMNTFDDAKQEQPDWRINYESEEQTIGADALTTKNLICWSLQIARGMVYLASKKVSTSV